MLMALVTTVRLGSGDGSMMSARDMSASAIAVAVVPPQSPITAPRGTSALAALAMAAFASGFCWFL